MNLRTGVTACVLTWSGFMLTNLPATPREPVPAARVTARPNVPDEHRPQGRLANRSRYRFHRDTWWYLAPDNSWAYWNGGMWVPYTGQADAANLAPGSLLGPIAGPMGLQGVFLRGPQAGLIRVGDRASTKMLPRGTVMPRFLRGEFTETPEREHQPTSPNSNTRP